MAQAAPSSAITHCLLPTRAGMPPTCSGSRKSSSPPWGFWRCPLNSGITPCWKSRQMGGRWCVMPRPGTSTTVRTSGLWGHVGSQGYRARPSPTTLGDHPFGYLSQAMQPNMALSEARSGVISLPCLPLHFPLPCGVLPPSLGVLPIKWVHRQPGSLAQLRQCCFHVAGSSSAHR